jgi:hypothetical protein
MQSVDQLIRQIADWFVDEYIRDAYAIVQIAEEVRRSSALKVGRCIGELSSGIFEILDHPTIVAICVLDRSGHRETILKHSRVSWTATTDNGLPLWYAERD